MTKLPTVDIKGKPYVVVNERLKFFRENNKGYSLETEVLKVDENTSLMRAVIRDENGVLKATGVSFEKAGDGFINKTSHVENCETSAWGRALANFGIGIDETVASADEVVNAINQKPKTREEVDKCSSGDVLRIVNLCTETATDQIQLYTHFKVDSVPTKDQAAKIIASLEKKLSGQIDSVSQ